jgi:hypothetical protein
MFTTIEALLGWTKRAALVLLAWAAILCAIPLLGSGRDLAVVGPQSEMVAAVASAGGQVIEVRDGTVIARAATPGFAARLYASGARLVIEGRIGAGCFRRLS